MSKTFNNLLTAACISKSKLRIFIAAENEKLHGGRLGLIYFWPDFVMIFIFAHSDISNVAFRAASLCTRNMCPVFPLADDHIDVFSAKTSSLFAHESVGLRNGINHMRFFFSLSMAQYSVCLEGRYCMQ